MQFETSKACNYSAHVFLPILFGGLCWYNSKAVEKDFISLYVRTSGRNEASRLFFGLSWFECVIKETKVGVGNWLKKCDETSS